MKKIKLTINQYHADPALGSTDLGHLLTRPSVFRAYRDGLVDQDKPCYAIGSALHSLVLEPDVFPQLFVPTDLDGRSKAFKDFVAGHADKTVIKQADMDMVKAMAESVMRNGTASQLLVADKEVEMSYFWTDDLTGVACKCRPDAALFDYEGRTVAIDLKTTVDASPRGMARSVANFGYHRQAAWYSHGIEVVTGCPVDLFAFIVVEKSPPYDCGVYYLSEEAIGIGWAECRKALALYRHCEATNDWPGLHDGLVELTLPEWYNTQEV